MLCFVGNEWQFKVTVDKKISPAAIQREIIADLKLEKGVNIHARQHVNSLLARGDCKTWTRH